MSPRKMILLAAAAVTLWGTRADSAILATDANAIAGFHGTQNFDAVFAPTLTLKADVDYAVYAPGQFKLTFGPAADPSADTRYVYAYQMHNTGGTADRDLGFLSVGFDQSTPGGSNPTDLGFLNLNTGDDPSSSSLIPAGGPPFHSATWDFSTTIADGKSSEILIFTSPFPPAFYDSSVQGGGLSKQSRLPSPVPEPGTALAACGLAGALLIRRRNSK